MGIVSGIDAYGTFASNNTISRAKMAAILCRLVQSESCLVFTLQPKPADLTVRTSSKPLIINGRPFYGLVDIGGEAYLPLALGDGKDAAMSDFVYYSGMDGESCIDSDFVAVDVYDLPSVLPDYCLVPPSGNVIGTDQPGPTVRIPSEYHKNDTAPILTLDGRFPMIKISDLFRIYTVNNKDSAIYVEIPLDSRKSLPNVERKPDLVGQALSGLLRSTPKETVHAIHDYLVNTLTYNPYTAASEAAYSKAAEQYALEHNRILACKYGICQNYAELFQAMCLRAGIPCEFISGFAGGPCIYAYDTGLPYVYGGCNAKTKCYECTVQY